MVDRLIAAAMRRLGAGYPRAALVAVLAVSYLVVIGGVVLLELYRSMDVGTFWLLVAVAEASAVVETLLAYRICSALIAPARRWLQGARDGGSTIAAAQGIAALPMAFFGRGYVIHGLISIVPFCAVATPLLGLPPLGGLVLLAGATVVLIYGLFLRFFGLELVMRPLLTRIAAGMPDDAVATRTVIPLRWKLLAGLPLINVITGITVPALTAGGDSGLHEFGIAMLAAVAVSFTISLELTALLARSVMRPLQGLQQATERVAAGDLEVRVPVVSNDETGALARSFNAMVAGLRERERLRDALGAYVDPDVAELILRDGVDLGGQEVEVSVLFLDIRQFTAFAERAAAREVVVRLNELFGLVVPLLERHGLLVNKFVGDGLLAVVGALRHRDDHADRAVAAAIEIARSVRARYGDELQVGIGVNSGTVVAGSIGGGGHVEFTIIGDAVNTAARVEQATRETGDDVLVTEQARAQLTRDFGGWLRRPGVGLKGKSRPVRLWAPRVLARAPGRAAPSPAARA